MINVVTTLIIAIFKQQMRVHEDTVTCVKLVYNSTQRIITTSLDATIKIWAMEEFKGSWLTSSAVSKVAGPGKL
jgi:WD40 repeat protein